MITEQEQERSYIEFAVDESLKYITEPQSLSFGVIVDPIHHQFFGPHLENSKYCLMDCYLYLATVRDLQSGAAIVDVPYLLKDRKSLLDQLQK